MGMTHEFMQCQGRELHFTQWGHGHREAVVLWHGLARTGRDFDTLAAHLESRYRVLCPDTPGRGLSQWAADGVAKAQTYNYPFYGACAVELLDRLGLKTVRWVGTSMGGQLGMYAASGPLAGSISHLVLNDIGPEVPMAAVGRIADYVGRPPVFDTLAAYEAWLRQTYAPFGPLTDATWRHLAATSHRRLDDGRIAVHYDPQIAQQLTSGVARVDFWQAYDRIACPVLLIRGAKSDVLPASVAAEMTRRGPKCALREVPECGHAPMLDVPSQMAIVTEFLAR